MSTTTEVFAAMGEAVAGNGGKALQRKFKVRFYWLAILIGVIMRGYEVLTLLILFGSASVLSQET